MCYLKVIGNICRSVGGGGRLGGCGGGGGGGGGGRGRKEGQGEEGGAG